MNKELSPLEALERIKSITILEDYEDKGLKRVVFAEEVYKEPIQIIETALKENQERIEELEETNHLMFIREHKNTKQLKALEIIKSKEMLSVFKDISGKCFIVFNTTAIEIPQEEYDLLKEELKCEMIDFTLSK